MNAVLTYIYGRGHEILRDPLIIDPGVEYICVTDNPKLSSPVWRICYDPLTKFYHNRLKFAYVKTHPFVYTNAETVLVIDGSMQITSSIQSLFDCKCDLLLKPHPLRHNIRDELVVWPNRGLSSIAMERYIIMAQCLGAKFDKGPLYETNISVWRKNIKTMRFGEFTHRIMMKLSDKDNVFLSNQLVMSLLLQTMFKNIVVKSINQQNYFIKYVHGTHERTKRQT